jgi:hypothetical protein
MLSRAHSILLTAQLCMGSSRRSTESLKNTERFIGVTSGRVFFAPLPLLFGVFACNQRLCKANKKDIPAAYCSDCIVYTIVVCAHPSAGPYCRYLLLYTASGVLQRENKAFSILQLQCYYSVSMCPLAASAPTTLHNIQCTSKYLVRSSCCQICCYLSSMLKLPLQCVCVCVLSLLLH